MIYISSNCFREHKELNSQVRFLQDQGWNSIELTGGLDYDLNVESKIDQLAQDETLQLRLHNYFPAPTKPFVLNLASTNPETLESSRTMVGRALKISDKHEFGIFAAHAGFAIDIPVEEIGQKISKKHLADKQQVEEVFLESLKWVESLDSSTNYYIENNVLSTRNYNEFGCNPLLCTHVDEIAPWLESCSHGLLLDVAHLKVSCTSLGLDFRNQLEQLWELTDYVHLSDNNGLEDENKGIKKGSELYESLSRLDWNGKAATLEVYSGSEDLEESYLNIKELIEA